jgi:glycine oxidase ThiO
MARDVIVIGGGVIGCAIAHELARRGCHVQLVADRALAQGATHASGGMLVPYVEAHHAGPMLELSVRSLSLYDEFVSRTRSDGVADDEVFEYVRAGSLQVAFTDDVAAALRRAFEQIAAQGVRADWLDREGLRRIEPRISDGATAGLLIAGHGVVGAEALTAALWSAATSCGARYFPATVTRVRRSAEGLTVEASGGRLQADVVVVAAGAWAPTIEIEGAPHLPIQPVRGQLVHLQWEGAPLKRILWGPRCYMVPWADGRLLVGATMEQVGFDERNTVAGVHDLLDAATELVPRAWTAAFDSARAGLRPGTPDGLPIIGRSPVLPGLVYATGHYRNGVLLAPVTASLVGDLIVDDREDPILKYFTAERFGGTHGKVVAR